MLNFWNKDLWLGYAIPTRKDRFGNIGTSSTSLLIANGPSPPPPAPKKHLIGIFPSQNAPQVHILLLHPNLLV